MLKLHWTELTPSPLNRLVRGEVAVDDPALRELADSIKRRGVIQPLTVTATSNGYMILTGERRWQATKLLGDEAPLLPCIVREVTGELQALLDMGTENIQRENLNPVAEARYYHALQENGLPNPGGIARELGKLRRHIEGRLALLDFSPQVQGYFETGALKLGAAEHIRKLPAGMKDEFAGKMVGRSLAEIEQAANLVLAKLSAVGGNGNGRQLKATRCYAPKSSAAPPPVVTKDDLTLALRATCAACEAYSLAPEIPWEAVERAMNGQCNSCEVRGWKAACEQCPLVDFLRALKKLPGNEGATAPAHLCQLGWRSDVGC
ncbi:MAG: ParB/RepB/Spo0J family partition protein [Anaerolineae bacterium]